MNYRPEIDGLRAIAVLPVILFHAGFDMLSGGFIGVDVFFVISGYLITTILLEDIERGNFSILKFYEKRARRILPALFFVALCSLPFAWMWMIPSALRDFAQSLVATSLFASNILFWHESGYFSIEAGEKPFFHTWSLAVEEQYYLFFPLLLLSAWRFGRNWTFWTIIALAAISLALSELGWRYKPTASYYLAPTRVWEIFAGSLSAFIIQKRGVKENELLSILGLALIVASALVYDETTPFPSIYTLAPVLGTALIVLFAAHGTLVARFLSAKIFVGIGLVSYSAYLWHQPLFAFARIRSLDEPTPLLMATLSVAALALAAFSWRFIEQPFRSSTHSWIKTRPTVFTVSAIGLSAFFIVGIWGHLSEGLPHRFSSEILAVANVRSGDTSNCHNALEYNEIQQGKDCNIGTPGVPPRVAIIGDSHAASITDAASDYMRRNNLSGVTFSGSWCVPLINYATDQPGKDGCLYEVKAAFEQVVARPEIDTVLLIAEWANYTEGNRPGEAGMPAPYIYSASGEFDWGSTGFGDNITHFEEALSYTLNLLRDHGKRVIIVSPVPEYGFRVPESLSKTALFGSTSSSIRRMTYNDYARRSGKTILILRRQAEQHGAVIADVFPAFCPDGICEIADELGRPLYVDGNHTSYYGGERVVSVLNDVLEW